MWCMYASEYYTAVRKKESLLCETTWMELEGIMHEISQTEKDEYTRYHLYEESKQIVKLIGSKVEKWSPGAGEWGK